MEARLEPTRLLEVIRKTARKMSPAALAAVGQIDLDARARALLDVALSP